jgi:8-oxo-dGTP pyrophosphatase MutT (NUDIX family)
MGEREWRILRGSQVGGRAHDVTLYMILDGRVAAIAKHPYEEGIYRAPSGGILPGETMEEGMAREMREEVGVEIRIRRYLLRAQVDFSRSGERVAWTTHVFTADPLSRDLVPRDRREIREARWVPLEELSGRIRERLLASPSAGLRYRALLHDRVMEELGPPAAPPPRLEPV